MGTISLFSISLMLICMVSIYLVSEVGFTEETFGEMEMKTRETQDFSIEYPSTWFLKISPIPEVQFLVKPSKSIRDELDGTLSVKKIVGFISVSNLDTLTSLIDSEKELCNDDESCEKFSLIESEIICLNEKSAYSFSYSFFKDGFNTNTQKIVIPIGNITWEVEANTIKVTKYWEDLKKSTHSFSLNDSQNTCKSASEFTSITPSESKTPKFSSLIGLTSMSSDSKILFEKPIDVNVILVGDKWSSAEIDRIEDNLRSSYEPLVVTTNEKAGIRYVYTYNFFHTSEENKVALFSFFEENKIKETPNILEGLWMREYRPNWVETDSEGFYSYLLVDFYRMDAEKMETFLFDTFIQDNIEFSKSSSVNLFFLKPDSEKLDFIYNYYVQNRDKATKEKHMALGMMGYGGNYNLYFFDLLAIPWIEFDFQKLEFGVPYYKQNLYQCTSSSCFAELVGYHIDSAILHIATPAYLYPVEYSEKYLFDIVVYSKPGASIGETPQSVKQYLNEDEIRKELKDLYPFSDSEINLSVERRDTRGLSYDFKKELEVLNFVDLESYGEYEKTVILLDSNKIQPYLLDWAEERKNLAAQKVTDNKSTKIIPTLVFIDVSQYGYEIYLDKYGKTGFAPSLLEKEGEPCCALGLTSDNALEEKYGVSDLVLHEVGHTLGLNHPFLSWDEFGDLDSNSYFNWYSSPMTYFAPNQSCEYLYNLVYDELCGISSASFTEFEKEHIANGILISLIKKTNSNLENFNQKNSALYNNDPQVRDIQKGLNDAVSLSQNGDNLSDQGAIITAITAYEKSKNLEDSTSLLNNDVSDVLESESQVIPEWIKNNANWWAQGSIGDSDFVSGIQYLIKEGIMQIPETVQAETVDGSKEIPSWIKNNAEWWAQGLITDDDFVKGIQYLVKQGIIRV